MAPAAAAKARNTIPRRPAGEVAPVSFGQEQIWLHSQLAPDVPLYAESLTIRRNGQLDANAFVTSFREIVRRHEIWRTTFSLVDGEPTQIVHQAGVGVRQERLRPVGEGLLGAAMDLDVDAVGPRRDRRAGHCRDQVGPARGVARVHDDRQVAQALDVRDDREVERVAGRVLERPHPALAEDDAAVALR